MPGLETKLDLPPSFSMLSGVERQWAKDTSHESRTSMLDVRYSKHVTRSTYYVRRTTKVGLRGTVWYNSTLGTAFSTNPLLQTNNFGKRRTFPMPEGAEKIQREGQMADTQAPNTAVATSTASTDKTIKQHVSLDEINAAKEAAAREATYVTLPELSLEGEFYVLRIPTTIPLAAVKKSTSGKSFTSHCRTPRVAKDESYSVSITDGDKVVARMDFSEVPINLTLKP